MLFNFPTRPGGVRHKFRPIGKLHLNNSPRGKEQCSSACNSALQTLDRERKHTWATYLDLSNRPNSKHCRRFFQFSTKLYEHFLFYGRSKLCSTMTSEPPPKKKQLGSIPNFKALPKFLRSSLACRTGVFFAYFRRKHAK